MRTLVAFVILVTPNLAHSYPLVLDLVPSYHWYHGCSPTASANIIGYWDLHGYDGLFTASGWKEVKYTDNVQDEISSPEHNAKYDARPDSPDLPHPPNTSIADFMGTGQGSLGYGATYVSNIDNGIENYAAYQGYSFDAQYMGSTWENFINEIDLGNPVVLNVDSSGNGRIDHSMTGIGYDDRGADGLWYASYNTWHESETINWYQFRRTSSDYGFGLYSMAYVHPLDSPIGGMDISYMDFNQLQGPVPAPEPATVLLFGTGLVGLIGSRLRKKK